MRRAIKTALELAGALVWFLVAEEFSRKIQRKENRQQYDRGYGAGVEYAKVHMFNPRP